MNKAISIVIELLILNVGLYFSIVAILGDIRGSGGAQTLMLLLGWTLILSSIFYILIRIGMEIKQKFLFFIPGVIYFFLLLIGPGAWFSSFFEGFTALGIIGLLFVALPISILLALRYLFVKLLASRK